MDDQAMLRNDEYAPGASVASFRKKRKTLLTYKKMREKLSEKKSTSDLLRELVDEGTFTELYSDLETRDPLSFPGYTEKLEAQKKNTDAKEALCCGFGEVDGRRIACAQLSKHFFVGSMGSVVGEKLVRLTEEAGKCRCPLIVFSSSGGARMQEGMFSLYQMAKTSAAINRFREAGGLFISVLLHPTTGGVSASFAMLGDIILAEPGALIGFAGPRVIEQTIGQKLPEGFQRAEFQLEHGFVDMIVKRQDMPGVIRKILRFHK